MQLATNGDESPRVLRLASQFLLDLAEIAEAELRNGAPLMPAEPMPTVDEASTIAQPPATVFPAAIDPAKVFAKPGEGFPPAPSGPMTLQAETPAVIITPPVEIPPPPSSPVVLSSAGSVAAPPAAPPTTGAASIAVDADGLPHDQRIHSETPTVTKDGRWRRRRGLDNATLVKVEAELRAVPPGTASVSLPPVVIPPPPVVVAAPNAPAAPVIPPPPVANPFGFRALMNKIDGHTGAGGKLSADAMKPVHAEFGATGWPDYVHLRLDKIPALMARIDEMLK